MQEWQNKTNIRQSSLTRTNSDCVKWKQAYPDPKSLKSSPCTPEVVTDPDSTPVGFCVFWTRIRCQRQKFVKNQARMLCQPKFLTYYCLSVDFASQSKGMKYGVYFFDVCWVN